MTDDRLFIGVFAGGVVYADRKQEEHGDYKRVGFLPYKSLVFEPAKGISPKLLEQAMKHASSITALRGQKFQVSSSGQYVILGE